MFLKKGDWVSDLCYTHLRPGLTRCQTPSHVHYSGYTMTQLKPLVVMISECCHDPRKHHSAVYEKYAAAKYKRASTYVEEQLGKGFTLPFAPALAQLPSSSATLLDDDSNLVEYNHNRMSILIPAEG
jgi:Cyclin, C-terminal domain